MQPPTGHNPRDIAWALIYLIYLPTHQPSVCCDTMNDHQTAPWLPIPSRAISAVEHPCIIKNIDKGIASLGGPARLSKVG